MLHTHEREAAGPLSRGDALATNETDFISANRKRLRAIAAGMLTGLALASPAETSRQANQVEAVGFNTNGVWVTDPEVAKAAAAKAARDGATQLRVMLPYTQGGAEIKNDLERTCNAAKAAHEQGLELMITMEGHYRSDGRLGYLPSIASEKQKYVTAITNMMWSLYGDRNPDGSGGCAPENKKLTLGFINEPNNKLFNANQYIDGKWVAPENTVELMSYAYPKLKKEAAREGLGVDLTLVGGEVSTSKSANAVGFIRQMGRYIKEKRIKHRIMDQFAAHYYLQGADADPAVSASQNIERVSREVKESFGADMPVIYNEVGAWAETPKNKEGLYRESPPGTIVPLSGPEQGLFYKKFLESALCQGVKSVLIFHHNDDGGGKYRTGVVYPDGSPKPSAPIVRKAFNEISSGKSC